MVAWWVVLAVLLILFIIQFISRDKRVKKPIDGVIGFLAVFQMLILIVALVLRDPIFELVGLPKEYEWLGGLFVSGFLLWQFYLSPLKERVIDTEKDVREIKTDVKNIREGIDRIDKKIV